MAPYVDLMRENIANALNLPVLDVSIKVKTNEGMDSAGRKEAIQAFAVILIDNI